MKTIRDVALRAGVSTATVSYVMNNKRRMSATVTDRVLKAVKDLRYTPSKPAQSLRRGSTNTIGLIMDEITNRFASQFIRGLENTASQSYYNIIISDLQEKRENEPRSLTMLLHQKVDGIIYDGYGEIEKRLLELYSDGFPIVVVDKPLATSRLPSVFIDNRASLIEALAYLKRLGHRRMLYLNGLAINQNSAIRARAFKDFMVANRLPFSEGCVVYGDYTLDHGYSATLDIIRRRVDFTALVCGDDLIAFGAIAALKSNGIRIPEDVAVVGFDDDPISSVFDPPLTTIHYPMFDMGRLAFQVFHAMSQEKRKKAEHIVMETNLVVRGSTKAPASRTPGRKRRTNRASSLGGPGLSVKP